MDNPTITKADLLPCPFCGGDGLTHRVTSGWRVSCKNCDAQPRPGFPSDTEAEAITAWNTRHSASSGAAHSGEPWPGCFADLQRRRVTTLAKLGLMLSVMASGKAAEAVGYDAATLYAEVLMALGIEDAEDTDIALEIARDEPDGDILAALSPEARSINIDYWNEVAQRLGHESVCEALEKLAEMQEAPSNGAGADALREALDELDGSDFEAVRRHSATIRQALATLAPPTTEERLPGADEGRA